MTSAIKSFISSTLLTGLVLIPALSAGSAFAGKEEATTRPQKYLEMTQVEAGETETTLAAVQMAWADLVADRYFTLGEGEEVYYASPLTLNEDGMLQATETYYYYGYETQTLTVSFYEEGDMVMAKVTDAEGMLVNSGLQVIVRGDQLVFQSMKGESFSDDFSSWRYTYTRLSNGRSADVTQGTYQDGGTYKLVWLEEVAQ